MAEKTTFHYKHSRLKQLRAFCRAAQTGSISVAADKLFLSQPTVTLQIQALERDLETTLFERRGPKIQLTPDGEVLYRLAHPMVKAMDTLPETFAAHRGRLESGELHIAAGESTILYILPEAVRRFTSEYPGISVKLHNVTGKKGLARLRSDEVDLAIGPMLETPADIAYRPIHEYDHVLITPLEHPLADKTVAPVEDISPYPLILPPRHLTTWQMVDKVFKRQGVPYEVTMEVGGWEVIKKYVELGLGVAIVTDVCLTGSEAVARIPLPGYFPKRTYGIVMRRGRYLSPQAKRFIETLDRDFFAPDDEDAAADGATARDPDPG